MPRTRGAQNPPVEPRDPVIDRLADLCERQARQIELLLQQQGRQNQQPPPLPPNAREHTDHVGERFRKLNPPIFEGGSDPMVAEEWMKTIEGMLNYAGILDAERVVCASFFLRKDAAYWWDSVKASSDVAQITWDQFKVKFFSKYFTYTHRSSKATEFMNLRQGGVSVSEYIRKFDELSRFAPHMVSTDALKVDHFTKGLKAEIFRNLSAVLSPDMTFADICQKAIQSEQGEQRVEKAQEFRRNANFTRRNVNIGKLPQGNQSMKRKETPNQVQGQGQAKRPNVA